MPQQIESKPFQLGPDATHPGFQIVTVRNDGEDAAQWLADGQSIVILPKEVQAMPRWVLLLGRKYPTHNLKELAPGEVDKAYEQAEKARLERVAAAKKAELAKLQEELKALEKDIKTESAKDEKKGKEKPE